MATFLTVEQAQTIATGITTKSDERFLKKADAAKYDMRKQATAEDGFASTYQLFEIVGTGDDKTETPVGAKINIAADIFVQNVSQVQIAESDDDAHGIKAGDKYVVFTVGTTESTDPTLLYLNLQDLVDAFTAGSGITISNENVISVKIDTDNANGLAVTSDGLKLAAATANVVDPETGAVTTAGTPGAMSAADKTKLDGIEVATEAQITALVNSLWA